MTSTQARHARRAVLQAVVDTSKDDRSGHNGSGHERDETEQYHRLVRQLVNDGDHRARSAGRHARRTLAEMAPGYDRQPVLRMTIAAIVFSANPRGTCRGSAVA
ncbi:hypothetical protein ACIP4W_40350 [Streptomyces sp. NPDC088846]|uniref:hypothetical protein n=1 Tax=Streptomyces sp. NPDC088846 TaxID=3365908 RepID=UPI0038228435